MVSRAADSQKQRLSKAGVSGRLWALLRKTTGQPTDENLSRRIGLVGEVLSVMVKNEWFDWSVEFPIAIANENSPAFSRVPAAREAGDDDDASTLGPYSPVLKCMVKSGLLVSAELTKDGPAMVEKIDDKGLMEFLHTL